MIPKPDHPINVSAYFDDSQRYGNFSSEVSGAGVPGLGWTNAHYCWAYRYAQEATTPAPVWIQGLVESCQRAFEAKRGIHINLNLQQGGAAATPLVPLLHALSPFWPRVTCLEMADEPRWTKVANAAPGTYYLDGSDSGGRSPIMSKTLPAALARRASTAATAAKVRAAVKSLGLSQRPLSVVYTTAQFQGAPVDSLDIVGIEAYCDLPGDPVSARNVKWLTEYLAGAIAKVPVTKSVHLVPMAYSRNYDWLGIRNMTKGSPTYRNAIQTLVDIMAVPYAAAKDNPRVVGLNFFSWARASGSREYKRLASQARALGAAACRG